MAVHVVKSDGLLALYNGLSASLCRQVCVKACSFACLLTRFKCELIVLLPSLPSHLLPSLQMSYSLTRFAIYETVRDVMGSKNQGPMPFYQKVLLGAFGGVKTHTHTHKLCETTTNFLISTNRVHWRFCWHASRHGERQVR